MNYFYCIIGLDLAHLIFSSGYMKNALFFLLLSELDCSHFWSGSIFSLALSGTSVAVLGGVSWLRS